MVPSLPDSEERAINPALRFYLACELEKKGTFLLGSIWGGQVNPTRSTPVL
jgi:hypothetical protein